MSGIIILLSQYFLNRLFLPYGAMRMDERKTSKIYSENYIELDSLSKNATADRILRESPYLRKESNSWYAVHEQ